MNDDFLRRMRRPPSAALERQLRERLRQQELEQPSRRRPSWKLLAIAMLAGGTALATATYLTVGRTPAPPSSPAAQTPTDGALPQPSRSNRGTAPVINRWLDGTVTPTFAREPSTPSTQQGSSIGAARNSGQWSSDAASDGKATATDGYISWTGSQTSAATRPVRVIMTPDIEKLVKDPTPNARTTQLASFAVDGADSALPTLCAEVLGDQPDVVVTSRHVRQQELRQCKKGRNGEILQATLGHIAIVVTRAKVGTPMQLSDRALRLALMKKVAAPDNSSQLIDNPYTHWNQIDPALEDRRIDVLGPARGTPEFLVFAATLLAPACENNASLDKQLCQSVREDGVYTEVRFDANFIPQRLWSDPNAVAIMNYRFYAANSADLLGSLLPGAAPTRESIVDRNYLGARTLHVYVNAERYRYVSKVSTFVNEYLRLPIFFYSPTIIPPDGDFDRRRAYDDVPKLTEVKLD